MSDLLKKAKRLTNVAEKKQREATKVLNTKRLSEEQQWRNKLIKSFDLEIDSLILKAAKKGDKHCSIKSSYTDISSYIKKWASVQGFKYECVEHRSCDPEHPGPEVEYYVSISWD